MAAEQSLPSQPKNRLIARALTPAIKAWLRSQLDSIDQLELNLDSGNRELLSGTIPQVFLATSQAIYRGIHLSQAQVIAQNICINLGQILRGKALQLLEPLPINLRATLTATDLQASETSALFQDALQQGLTPLIAAQLQTPSDWPFPGWQPVSPQELPSWQLQSMGIRLANGTLLIHAQIRHPRQPHPQPILLRTGLILTNPHELRLENPQGIVTSQDQPIPLTQLHDFCFDLGPEVSLQTLSISLEAIECQGQIVIMPIQRSDSSLA